MPILDTPITTDDHNLRKVLAQKQPVLLVLHDGKKDAPLEDALKKAAKKYAGELLVVQVDVTSSPDTHAQYKHLATPALVTLVPAVFGRKVKSQAASARPADVRLHVEHLLHDTPLPEPAAPNAGPSPASSAKPLAVSDRNFEAVVLRSKQPVLVDFWAAWCGPCRSIAPYVEQLAKEYQGRVKVAKLDTDANQKIAQQYDIRSIPTFILFRDGKPVARFSGASQQQLRRMVEDASR